jgi:hypothetical protein
LTRKAIAPDSQQPSMCQKRTPILVFEVCVELPQINNLRFCTIMFGVRYGDLITRKLISVSEWLSSRVCQIDFRQRFRALFLLSACIGLTNKQGAQQSKILKTSDLSLSH